MIDVSGNTTVGRSDRILNIGNEFTSEAGTLNPESVFTQNGRAWWWDLQNAAVQQYAANGITAINDGRNRYFWDQYLERFKVARTSDIVLGGYDRKHDMYILSFGPGSYFIEGQEFFLVDDTLGYDIRKGGWGSHFSWKPECMSVVNSDLILFKDGALWTNFKGDQNKFFGTVVKPTIKFVVNENPQTDKDWFCIRIQSKRQWIATEILTTIGTEQLAGMRSKLTAANFFLKANMWFADFLRDMDDPHTRFTAITPDALKEATALLRGRHLKGEALTVTLEALDGTKDNNLWAVQVDWSDNQVTP